MTQVNIVKMHDVTDPSRIVDALLSNKPQPGPHGYIVVAPVNVDTKGPLCDAVDRLEDLRHDPSPILVGVVEDMSVVEPLGESFSTTFLVSPANESRVEHLLRFSELFVESQRPMGSTGSARLYDVPLDGISRQDPNLERKLANVKGKALHSIGRVPHPDTYAIAAPGHFIDPARRALGAQAPILGSIDSNQNKIHVGAFTFDEENVRELVAQARPQPTLNDDRPPERADTYPPTDGEGSSPSRPQYSSRNVETIDPDN